MYQLFAPHPALRPTITHYWRLAGNLVVPFQQAVLVDGCADVMFNFGAGYQRQHTDTQAYQTASHLDAQRDYPISLSQHGQVSLWGIRFGVGGLSALLRMPLHTLSNQTLDLDRVFGTPIRYLEEQLFLHQDDSEVVCHLLDDFFLRRLAPSPAWVTVQHALSHIQQTHGNISIAQLSAEVGYSARTIDRLFGQTTGFAPKFYVRMTRFHHALQWLHTSPKSLSEIAFLAHYYDQAHFHKDFVAFSGQTPEDYRRQNVLLPSTLV
jgi:AraC-like DNA-binding protein